MVEIEAAQEILVGFALAGMLGDDQPGTTSSASPTRRNGARVEFLAADAMALAAVGCSAAAPTAERRA